MCAWGSWQTRLPLAMPPQHAPKGSWCAAHGVLEAVARLLTRLVTRTCHPQRDLRAANAQLTARIDELAATSARAQRDAAEAREQVAQVLCYKSTANALCVRWH